MPVNEHGKNVSPHAPAGEYTAEELDWIRAMDALRKRLWQGSPRRLPAASDVLREAHRLGYRKVGAGEGVGVGVKKAVRKRAARGKRPGGKKG